MPDKPSLVEQVTPLAEPAPNVVQDPRTGLPFVEGPGMLDQGFVPEDPRSGAAATVEAAKEAYYDNPADKALALGEGVVGAASLGGSDWLLDALGADTAGRADALGGYRVGGEIVGGVGASLFGGAGAAGLGRLLAGPGGAAVRGGEALAGRLGGGFAARTAGLIAEGTAFGVGQGISNLALRDPELSAEAIAGELITNGLYGGLAGGVAGVAAGGLGRVAKHFDDKVKAIDDATAAFERESTELAAAKRRLFPTVADDEAEVVTRDFVDAFNETEQAAHAAAKSAQLPMTAKDIIYSSRMSRQLMEEAEAGLVDGAKVSKELRAAKNARRELSRLWGSNELFDRPELLDVHGLSRVAERPDLWEATAKHLDDWRTAAEAMSVKAGMGGRTTAAVFDDATGRINTLGADATDAMLAKDPHHRIRAVAQGKAKYNPAVDSKAMATAMEEVNESVKVLNKAWGVKTARELTPNDLKRFMLIDSPAKAAAAAQAYQDYTQALGRFVKKFDDGAAGAGLARANDKLEAAMAKLRTPEWSGRSSVEILQDLGMKGAGDVLDLTGHADDLMKAWIARTVVQKSTVADRVVREAGSKGGGALDILNRWGRRAAWLAGNDAGRAVARSAGAPVPSLGGRMIQAGVAMATGRVGGLVMGLVGGAARIAEATGAHTARIARATAKLAAKATRGAAKAARATAPTATALLGQYSFGMEKPKPTKNMQEAYKARMSELSALVADPQGARQRVHDALDPVRQIHPMLADHLEEQALNDAAFLYEKAPKDPGGMNVLGLSRWKPSEDEIVRWAGYYRGLDPAGVWERVASGRVTPQEAEFLRARRPNTFAEIQRSMITSLPEIQQNATYDQQNRMSILFDVPVNPWMAKHTSNFIQQQFAERAAADNEPVKMNAGGFAENEPSPAQKLQSR